MADLYINPQGYVDNNQVPPLTGNEKADAYLNTLPVEQRAEALKRLNAPLTGEEVAQKLHNDTEFTYTPTKQEFDAFSEYQAKKETSLFDGMSMFADAAGGIYDIAGNVISSIYDHPLEDAVKLAPSLLEGGTQNIRNWYGMLAQSQDPSSVLFKWKNVLSRDGSDSAYKQFLEARQFAKESVDYETGAKTLLVNKDYIDPALTQAATIIVDPMFYGSFLVGAGEVGMAEKVAQILGMSERLAKAGAFAEKMKGAVYGGTLKYGVGVPLEFIGGITRGAIDKAVEGGSAALEWGTGVSAQELKTAARVGGFGSIGFGVPYISPTSKVYLGAGFAAGMGEALSATGEQIMKNQGKRGLLSFAEQAIAESDAMLAKGGSGLTPQARRLLGVLDKVDPMLSYTGAFLEGGAHGAVIGAGLGYLGGGEEGMYSVAGAGFGIGSLGGLAGRAMTNVGGGLEKQRLAVQMDMLMPMLKDVDPTTHSSLELMREANKRAGNPDWVVDRYIVALDKIAPDTKFRAGGAVENEAVLKALGQDPKVYDGFERDANGAYKLDKDGNKIKLRDAEGFTVPTMEQYNSAGWALAEGSNGKYKVHINTDKYSDIANTLPHEMFHGIFRELGMKNEFKDRINEHILGTFDAQGNQIKPPSISKYEAESFFNKYINNTYTGAERDARLASLKPALDEYYSTGKMTAMEADGKTPVLAGLTEEFGAYYWTHFLNDKPVDYLFRGGELGGMRGVLDSVKNKWQDYMERKVGAVNGGFDFAREQYLNPSFKDANGKRIRVSALDYMMQDLIRTKSAASKGQGFDFNKLSPDGQEAYVRASGNSIVFEPPKVKGGKWKVRTPAQQKAVRAKNAGAMFTGLEAFRSSNPDALKTFNANGIQTGELKYNSATKTYEGQIPDAIVDYFVKSGHIDKVEGERIKLLQKAANGETPSNVFEFNEYTGDTMNIGIGQNLRVKAPFVATKDRLVILTKFEPVIGQGDYGFYAHTLDYRHLLVRQDAMWKDPKVRAAWGDDRDAFTADLFRYFKNASQPDGVRLPSAQLWAENGEYKRNVLHQVAGLETPATGTINKSLGDIKGDMFSTYRKFRTDRMTGERMSGEKIDLTGDNATDYIRYNMMPSEMADEATPNGHIYTHPNGYKFFQVEAGIKAHKPDGTVIGTFKTIEEATAKADAIYQKENPTGKPIPSVDNIRQEPLDAPETQEQYVARKMNDLKERINSNKLTNSEKESVLNSSQPEIDFLEHFKEQYNREQQAVNPPFVSGLSLALDKILPANLDKNRTIQASRLINQMRNAAGGDLGSFINESKAIGFEDWLKSKGQSRVSEAEIRQYIKEKGIQVYIDPRTDIRGNEWQGGGFDTSTYVAEGKTEGYHTFVVRINPEHAHGVEGHFGKDAIVHIRATTRTDAQGRKVLFVEEIQSINTAREALPETQRKVVESDLVKLKELLPEIQEVYDYSQQILNQISKRKPSDNAESYANIATKKTLEKIRYDKELEKLRTKYNLNDWFDRPADVKMLISEKESKLSKVKSNKPLQDMPETVKIASRAIMRKAVELGADRVVLVRPEDMHPQVSTNAEGERFVDTLYGKTIPEMIDAELKKYGQKLAPARNFDDVKTVSLMEDIKEGLYGNSGLKETAKQNISKQILSDSLGYDVTPEMKQKAGRSQTFMMPAEGEQGGKDWSTERAYNARTNQPMQLWVYPNTENFKKWSGNLPVIKSLSEQTNPVLLENGFVTTVYKGVANRDFDTFKGRNKNPEGQPEDSYGRIIKEGDKDPNYFISDYKSASVYAKDVIGYEKKHPKMFKDMVEKRGLSNGKADMYYIRSESPAVFINITKDSKIYSDLYNWWKENIRNEYAEDSIKENPKKFSKLVEYNFDAFVEMINKGEFLEDKHWEQTEGGISWWQDFAKDFLGKGYDSIVIKDTTVHKSIPTIIIDQGSTNVKAASNYGEFSPKDIRFNYMPAEQTQAWRDFKAEPTTEGNSIFKNAMNYVIIQANNKFKVYNPQKALLGIYNDLEQAKRRVQREEPKPR